MRQLSKLVRRTDLLRSGPLINGKWTAASTPANSFPVQDPGRDTHTPLAMVHDTSVDETKQAIDAAYTAQPHWASMSGHERSKILLQWHRLVLENQSDLAALLTLENGKPLHESRGEILYGASYIQWFAEESKRINGLVVSPPIPGRHLTVVKQPVGVVAAISPWNFPNAMIARKLAPAFAAGCSVVLKPAPETPLSALALGVLAQEAGIPDGILNIITASRDNTASIGNVLSTSKKVAKITFTGSTAVGRRVMELASSSVKRLGLELGGHAPMLIFPSFNNQEVHLKRAVDMLMAAKFRNAGQTCIAPNRIYVHSSIHDLFVEELTQRVMKLKVGHGLDGGVQVGPLINSQAVAKVDAHVQDAISKGVRVICGGRRLLELGENYYAPTVLSQCTHEMRLAREETFGPICPVFSFDTEQEALDMANDSEYGLAAYAYTTDMSQSFRLESRLQYGMIGINEGLMSYEVAPFGGIKQSGFGREGSIFGLDEFLQLKYICRKISEQQQ